MLGLLNVDEAVVVDILVEAVEGPRREVEDLLEVHYEEAVDVMSNG